MKSLSWTIRLVAVSGIAVFFFASPAGGQECPEYTGVMDMEMWTSTPSQVQVSGSYAYLGGPSVLSITDVTDPEEPRVVGRIRIHEEVTDLVVSANRLFFISRWCFGKRPRGPVCYRKIHVADVSDAEHPRSLWTSEDLDFSPRKIAVSGDRFFIVSTDGLRVLDVTDSSNPVEVGYLTLPWEEPSGLVVADGLAYVAVPDSGLRIIDVSDPANPVEVGFWAATWEAHDLEVADGFAYVADGDGGFRVIDASNPAEPTEIGMLTTEHGAVSVSVDGARAVMGMADQRIAIVDMTNISEPVIVGYYETNKEEPDVALVGNTAYVISQRFRVLDLAIPDSPTELSSFGFRTPTMDLVVSNGMTYVASGDSGLFVLNESNPDEVVQGFLDTPGFALGVTLHEGFALVADDHKGLRIIDVSDPANLAEVGYVDTPGQARRIAVADNYAYVADGEGGLRIVDISMPETPTEVGAIDTPEAAVDVAVEGDYAYVVDGFLQIFDVSDPIHPERLDRHRVTPALAVAIKDEVLFLANSGVSVSSLSTPYAPRLLASGRLFPWYHTPTDIMLSGHHAYVTTDSLWPAGAPKGDERIMGGVYVFEIQNFFFPSLVGRWLTYGDFFAAAVSNGRIYLAGEKQRVLILDSRCLRTYWVEIVTNHSPWRSDVIISHEVENSVDFEFILHTEHGEFSAVGSVDAGHQGVFEDIVGLLGYKGKGALEIQATDPITISSRVYSETEPGTHGAFLQAHRSSDCFGSGRLNGLRQVEGEFRTNIYITNTSNESRTVEITLYRTDGEELVRYRPHVNPGMVFQDLQPFKRQAAEPNLGWGYATVETVGGGRGIVACASVIDVRTNDAVIVPMTR